MTKPIECTTSSTQSSSEEPSQGPYSPEEVDRRLAKWLKGHKAHVTVIDHREQGDFKFMQMTWEEFFINLDFYKKRLKFFTIIKQDSGPMITWVEKEKADDAS